MWGAIAACAAGECAIHLSVALRVTSPPPAAYIKDENRDDVKTLNSLMKYAKTVTIRNLQLDEKKQREAAEKDAERARELEMEIQRLEQIKVRCASRFKRVRLRHE